MNALLRQAIQRSRALRSNIPVQVSEVTELPPQAFPSEPDPPPARPKYFPWFSITEELGPRKILISQIQRSVAAHFGIKVTDLISARRTRDLIIPRHIAIYLAKEMTPRSLPAIGRAFGGRDHTTALNAIRNTRARLELGDPEVTAAVAAVRAEIEGQQ